MADEQLYDFLIIGSGFGGSVSALRLSEKGYRVAVLEAGKRYRAEDYATTNWKVHKYLWFPRLRCFGILRMTLLSDMLVLSGTGVGGGSLGYANTLLEPPEPFYRDPQWAGMGDWKAILAPHFATAKRMLGVTTNTQLYPADELLRSVAEEMGRGHTFKTQDVGVYFGEPEVTVPDPYFGGEGPARTGCRFCGGCMVGCRYGAKNTLDQNYLYLAEKHGAEVFPETEALTVREREGGGYLVDTRRSTGWWTRSGRRRFAGRQLILAAGVVGTLPLLFRCRERGLLPRLSPMLGARVRTNSEALTGVTARDDRVDYAKGIAITSSIFPDDVTHVEPVRYPQGSDLMGALTTVFTGPGGRWLRPLRWFATLAAQPLVALRHALPFGWARRSIVLLVMQTLDNSVRVFRRRRWWWPFSRAMVSRPEGNRPRVPAFIRQAQEVTLALAKKSGGDPRNAINEVVLGVGTTAHILGGCAIGPSPETGVIDGQNRVYGHEGLYIIDGSMIPANLGVNPSLTITALAEHAMSHISNKES